MTAGLWLLWLIPMAVAGIGMSVVTWWDIRHPTLRDDGILKLSDIILGVFLAVCPFINIFVGIGITIYFLTQVAPKIVVIGRKT